MSSDPPTPLNAALEGRYRIERELGEGGMATVYLADDLKHERKVALKVLKPELAAAVGAERFLAEIKTTANLHHPHILPLFDSGEADGMLFYVMPYVKGESLRDRLDREHQLPVDDAVRIATNMAEALDFAHRQGVIHRDIKPANVLLQDGKPVISDFGIALAVGAAGGGRLTETGLSVGTPKYMSPEQAMGEAHLGPATDVFSLGCVLYEMLVGEPPFAASTPQAVLGRVLTSDSQRVRVRRSSVPEHVDAAVARSLEPVPADRFTSATAMRQALSDPGFRHGPETAGAGSVVGGGVLVIVSVLVAAITAAVTWGLAARSDPAPVIHYTLDFPPGQERASTDRSMELSPDGSLLVYAGPGPQLWARRRDLPTGEPIEGTDFGAQPTFSPDGSRLAFVTTQEQLLTVPVDGGPPRVLVESNVRASGVAWAPDGNVYFTMNPSLTLHRILADGSGQPESLMPFDMDGRAIQYGGPEALPSGRGVLFQIQRSGREGDVAVLDLSTDEHRVVTTGSRPRFAESGHLLFMRSDGSLYAAGFDEAALAVTTPEVPIVGGLTPGSAHFDISSNGRFLYHTGGTSQPVWVDRDGTESPVDPRWFGAQNIDISPDGHRAVFVSGGDLWLKDLPDGQPVQFTFDGTNLRPAWTWDGASVIFLSRRGGNEDVWIRRADGSQPPRLLLDDDRPILQVVPSPDGERLALRIGVGGERDLYWAELADPVPVPLRATAFAERTPTFSPDGRWVAYVSIDTGQDEIHVTRFPPDGGDPIQVSRDGGTQPLWSHGGSELFYLNGRNELVAAQLRASETVFLEGQNVLFSGSDIPDNINGRSYDVDSDDQRFMIIREGAGAELDRVTGVESFFSVLEQLVND